VARSAGVVLIKEIHFLEPTAPPPICWWCTPPEPRRSLLAPALCAKPKRTEPSRGFQEYTPTLLQALVASW